MNNDKAEVFENIVKYQGAEAMPTEYAGFYPIYSTARALLPRRLGSEFGAGPYIGAASVVEHISSVYRETSLGYVTKHALVVVRYAERVAEYAWEETSTPITIPDPDPEAAPGDTITYFDTVGAYVSHSSDGSSVSLRDITGPDGDITPYSVSISPSLTTQATSNTYGLISGALPGATSIYPGVLLTDPFGVPIGMTTAEIDAWQASVHTCIHNILLEAQGVLDAKLYSTSPDINELRPFSEYGLGHRLLSKLVAVSASNTKDYTIHVTVPAASVGTTTSSITLSSTFDPSVFTGTFGAPSFYSQTGMSSWLTVDAAAPPDSPYEVEAQAFSYTYLPDTKTFSPVGELRTLNNTFFSRSTVAPLLFGASSFVSGVTYGEVKPDGPPYYISTAYATGIGAPKSDAAVSSDMAKACCVMASDLLSYSVYQALTARLKLATPLPLPASPIAGREYRKTAHTQTSGAFSFEQPLIPGL